MRKTFFCTTLATLLMIGILSSSSVQAIGSPQIIHLGAPSLTWDCDVGDAMVLNFNTFVNLDISSEVWASFDDWLLNDMNITVFTAEDVYAVYQALLPRDLGLKFTIDSIEGYWFNRSASSITYEEGKMDVVNATLNLRNGTASPWLTPAQYLNNTLDVVLPFVYDFMKSINESLVPPEEQKQLFFDGVKYQMTQDIGVVPRPFELSSWETDVVEYYTENNTEVDEDTGPINPTVQPGDSGPGALLILPHEMNFGTLYDEFKTAVAGTIPGGLTWDQFVASLGFSSVVIKQRAIAIAFNLEDISETGPMYPQIAAMLSNLDMYGIHNLTASVKVGIEWNEKGILSAFGLYIDGSASLDITAMIPVEGPEAGEDTPTPPEFPLPPIVNETFPISIVQTIAGDEITPPSEDQILEGLIGEERPGSTPPTEPTTPTTPAFNIPGYPVGIIIATVFVTTSVIIMKKRRIE